MKPSRKSKDPPETIAPAAGETAGAVLAYCPGGNSRQIEQYHDLGRRSIASYTIGPDLLVKAFAFAESAT